MSLYIGSAYYASGIKTAREAGNTISDTTGVKLFTTGETGTVQTLQSFSNCINTMLIGRSYN